MAVCLSFLTISKFIFILNKFILKPWKSSIKLRFDVAMRLFIKLIRGDGKVCLEQKKLQEGQLGVSSFWRHLWAITEQTQGILGSIYFMLKKKWDVAYWYVIYASFPQIGHQWEPIRQKACVIQLIIFLAVSNHTQLLWTWIDFNLSKNVFSWAGLEEPSCVIFRKDDFRTGEKQLFIDPSQFHHDKLVGL